MEYLADADVISCHGASSGKFLGGIENEGIFKKIFSVYDRKIRCR